MISRNTCTYCIHLRNETTMCHCSHYNIASSSFQGKLAKPEIVVAAFGSSQSLVVATGQIVAVVAAAAAVAGTVVVAVPDATSVVASISLVHSVVVASTQFLLCNFCVFLFPLFFLSSPVLSFLYPPLPSL